MDVLRQRHAPTTRVRTAPSRNTILVRGKIMALTPMSAPSPRSRIPLMKATNVIAFTRSASDSLQTPEPGVERVCEPVLG